MQVTKISLWTIGLYFILYIALHYLIARMFENAKKVKQKNIDDGITLIDKGIVVEDVDLETKLKVLNFLYKWFPAIYVLFLFLILFGL